MVLTSLSVFSPCSLKNAYLSEQLKELFSCLKICCCRHKSLTCVVVNIQVCRYFNNVPSARFPVIWEVHMVFVVEETKRHLVTSEGPGTKLHDAGLLVEWEVCHINRTWRLKNTRTILVWVYFKFNLESEQKIACPAKYFFPFVFSALHSLLNCQIETN